MFRLIRSAVCPCQAGPTIEIEGSSKGGTLAKMIAKALCGGIRAQGVSKSYRYHEKEPGLLNSFRSVFVRKPTERTVLTNVSLNVATGEAVGLLGPNGSGKSTLIKCLTGVLTPDSGCISVAGYSPQKRKREFLREIGVVLGQKSQLLWELPPWDAFSLHSHMYGIDSAEVKQRVEHMAHMLRVSDVLTTPVRRLSLGQRMKCEIIAVLLHRPSILFLDEPTIGLDVVAKRDIRRFIHWLVYEQGISLLLSSHVLADIEALNPRVLLLHRGTVIHDGPLESLDVRMQLRHIEVDMRNLDSDSRTDLERHLDGMTGVQVRREDGCLLLLVPSEAMPVVAEVLFSPQYDLNIRIAEPRAEQVLADYFDHIDNNGGS